MGEFQAKGYICERCHRRWVPRDQNVLPAVCPSCKSPYWNRKRRDSSTDIRFSGDTRGHENTIPIHQSVKEAVKRAIEQNPLVFDRLAEL